MQSIAKNIALSINPDQENPDTMPSEIGLGTENPVSATVNGEADACAWASASAIAHYNRAHLSAILPKTRQFVRMGAKGFIFVWTINGCI